MLTSYKQPKCHSWRQKKFTLVRSVFAKDFTCILVFVKVGYYTWTLKLHNAWVQILEALKLSFLEWMFGIKFQLVYPKRSNKTCKNFFRKNWWKLSKVYMISLRMMFRHAKYGSSQPVLFCKKCVSGICKIHRKILMMESFSCNVAGLQQLCFLKNCAKIFRTNFL